MAIYEYETNDFHFGSTNCTKVDIVKTWFDNGLTVADIKANKIKMNRHALMVDLTLWGHCELAESYWQARDLRQALYNDLIDSFPKTSSKRVLMKDQGWNEVAPIVFAKTGWMF